MEKKRIFFVTRMGVHITSQMVYVAQDLQELAVDILHCIPPPERCEYRDSDVIRLMTNIDTWENSYYLVSEYDAPTKSLKPLVVDHS